MGSSFTQFAGHGFWARDPEIEVWLYLLAREAEQIAEAPAWLERARQHWHTQATGGFNGSVSPSLDQLLMTADSVALVRGLSERALGWLRAQGPALPTGALNSFGTGGGKSAFIDDVPVAVFAAVGEAFIKLLDDQVDRVRV